jgi:hypothetical protein
MSQNLPIVDARLLSIAAISVRTGSVRHRSANGAVRHIHEKPLLRRDRALRTLPSSVGAGCPGESRIQRRGLHFRTTFAV